MLEGVLTGLAGSVAAVLLLFIGREVAVPQILGHIQDDPDVRAMAFAWTAAILVAGGLAGASTADRRTFVQRSARNGLVQSLGTGNIYNVNGNCN